MKSICSFCLLVCVEVLRPSQTNGVMSSTVSLPNHTFTGQAKSSKWLTSIVHLLSPATDNCPSWISGRERMTVENISWSISTKECCRPRRSRTRDVLISSRTPPRPARFCLSCNLSNIHSDMQVCPTKTRLNLFRHAIWRDRSKAVLQLQFLFVSCTFSLAVSYLMGN